MRAIRIKFNVKFWTSYGRVFFETKEIGPNTQLLVTYCRAQRVFMLTPLEGALPQFYSLQKKIISRIKNRPLTLDEARELWKCLITPDLDVVSIFNKYSDGLWMPDSMQLLIDHGSLNLPMPKVTTRRWSS